MKRDIHIDEFEKFLREKSDQYKVYPSDKIWNNINRSVHSGRKWPYIILTLFVFLGSAVLVDYKTFNYVIPGKKLISQTVVENSTIATSPYSVSHSVNTDKQDLKDKLSSHNNTVLNSTPKNTKKDIPTPQKIKATIANSLDNNENTDVAVDNNENDGYADHSNISTSPSKIKNSFALNPIVKNNGTQDKEETNRKKVLWAGEAFKKSKFQWQISFSPTVSYRRLTGGIGEITSVFRGIPYNLENQNTPVNKLVNHKPAIGAEVGMHGIYKLTDNFTLRAGLQLNYSRYQVSAFNGKPEMTTLALQNNGITDSVGRLSMYENYSGAGASWLDNEYLQISAPIGFEWTVVGRNSPLKWNVGASAQPVYNFANNVYLLSADYKHYVQDPSLIKRWNINAGIETFVSYDMGSFKWQVGPQFRYQLTSSYKQQYPIKEYLADFGFKIGVTKTLR